METVRESEIGTATWEAFHFGWNPHAHPKRKDAGRNTQKRAQQLVVWDFVCCPMNHVPSLQC